MAGGPREACPACSQALKRQAVVERIRAEADHAEVVVNVFLHPVEVVRDRRFCYRQKIMADGGGILEDLMGCSEVWDESELNWQAEYSIKLPTGGVVIFKNVTEWELLGVINGEKLHAVRGTLDEIFRLADEQIRERVTPQTLRALTRRDDDDRPVTAEQRRVLKRLITGVSFDGMTRSDANQLIHARLNVLVGRSERV